MRDTSASPLGTKRRRGRPKKISVGSNQTSILSSLQSQKGSTVSKTATIKPKSGSMIEAPRVTPATASRHGMTLRNSTKQDLVHNQDSHSNSSSDLMPRPSRATTSTLPAFSTVEPVVRASSPMPHEYNFVPKGNPYVTRNCRQQTQRTHQVVYAVVNDDKEQIGIRVPSSIYAAVLQSEVATRQDRQRIVRKHDEALEKCFSEAILAEFPRMPPIELPTIVRRAMVKRAGRVGRTGTKEMVEKARLAVHAHIRHTKTDYDRLLRGGIDRKSARDLMFQKALDIQKQWGPIHMGRQKLETKTRHISTKTTHTHRKRIASMKGATALKDTAKSANPQMEKALSASRGRPAEERKVNDTRIACSIAGPKLEKRRRCRKRRAKISGSKRRSAALAAAAQVATLAGQTDARLLGFSI
ncbi:hypothetical protein HD806DRAFT_486388 [Xylariaceae sp. AK1471]|nr:hypothetical protein HD806DRAFT_486388 [Xylariaceae sp. AK1471]